MKTSSFVRFALSCVFCVTISNTAWSQAQSAPAEPAEDYRVRAPSTADESYGVVFEDDPMFALGPDALIPRLTVRKGVPMTMLLRARTSFVPEILKSAETF